MKSKSTSNSHALQTCCVIVLLMGSVGCQRTPHNRIEVTDHRSDYAPQQHYEQFQESYFSVSDNGLVELVLRRMDAQGPTHERLSQLLHINAYWKPFPGRTHAENSMLNANVSYVLTRGSSAISYEGGGFLEFKIDDDRQVMKGRLSGADLTPLRRIGSDLEIFERASINGKFKALRHDRHVMRIRNNIDSRLGSRQMEVVHDRGPDY